MSEELRELYFNPKYGYSGINKFFDTVNKLHPNKYKRSEIADFVKSTETSQIFSGKSKKSIPIVGAPNSFQIDLAFFDKYASVNNNISILFNMINVNTRFAYVEPIKNKNSSTCFSAFKSIIDKNKLNISSVSSDFGTEFNDIKKWCNENNIKYYSTTRKNNMGIIERFNRTIRDKINRVILTTNSAKYLNKLPDLVDNYNNSVNRGIGYAPADVTPEIEAQLIDAKHLEISKVVGSFDIAAGDTVRIHEDKNNTFEKDTSIFTKETHKITGKKSDNAISFKIAGSNKSYPVNSLLKINSVVKPDKPNIAAAVAPKVVKRAAKTKRLNKLAGVSQTNIIKDKRIKKIKKVIDL